MSGKKAEALKIIRDPQERSKKEFVPSYSIATVYIGLEMKEEALQYLMKAYEEGSYHMILLKVDPLLDPLRSDSRFTNVMQRVEARRNLTR